MFLDHVDSFAKFLDHVDSFAKFLKFFCPKNIFTLVKKRCQNTVFAAFSKIQFLVNFPC